MYAKDSHKRKTLAEGAPPGTNPGERRRRQTAQHPPSRVTWVEPKRHMSAPVVAASSPLAGQPKKNGSRLKPQGGVLSSTGVSIPVEMRDSTIHVPIVLNDRVLAKYVDGMAMPATVVENPKESNDGSIRYKVRFDDGYVMTVSQVQPMEEYFKLAAARHVRADTNTVRCSCDINTDVGFMIQCERCATWQHGRCIGITPDSVPVRYLCAFCEVLKGNSAPIKKWKHHWKAIKDGESMPWLPFIDIENMGEHARSQRLSESHGKLLVQQRQLDRLLVAVGVRAARLIEEGTTAAGAPVAEADMERWLTAMEADQHQLAEAWRGHAVACSAVQKLFTDGVKVQ